MGKALYRKYRSKSLDEIVGQDHITSTLKNALKSGRISHAYLLTGPRGVGKTSIARILAHEINGLPYSEDSHLDIIEIDAASNRRIDEMRELRDRVQSAPTSAKYKVYIIDEVHMLTKEAFNALLKTLEEPPDHVIFILATTEAHKLPETIVSRTQRYSFRPVSVAEVVKHLQAIAEKEKIIIDNTALKLIAEHGDGSFRDSISLLDQASSINDDIHLSDIEQLLGRASSEQIDNLQINIAANDIPAIVTSLHALYGNGLEPAMIASQLGKCMREQVIRGSSSDVRDALTLLHELLGVPSGHSPKQLLEIILLRHAQGAPKPSQVKPSDEKLSSLVKTTYEQSSKPKTKTEPETLSKELSPAETTENFADERITAMETLQPSNTLAEITLSQTKVGGDDADDVWQAVLREIKQTHNTLYGIARMAKPSLADNELTVQFKFAFHAKRLKEPKNHDVLIRTVEKVRGKPTRVHYVIAETSMAPLKKPSADITSISNIFGSAELIE